MVAVVLWAWLIRSDGREAIVVREPVAFNLLQDDAKLERAAAAGRRVAAAADAGVATPNPQSFVVRPVVLPAYSGDAERRAAGLRERA